MINVAFVVYRSWGYEICKKIILYSRVRKDFVVNPLIIAEESTWKVPKKFPKGLKIYRIKSADQEAIKGILKKNNISIVFFYSWSFVLKEEILNSFICLCLHPSLLPHYRGGTPIQHQLIDGITDSGVTVFKMSKLIDGGDIYKQEVISLSGRINDIFRRMVDVGVCITKDIIVDYITTGTLHFTKQKNLDRYSPKKRRMPKDSEILFSQLSSMTFERLNNLVRGLLYPYPNTFIRFPAGTIYLQRVEKFIDLKNNSYVLQETEENFPKKNLYLKLKNGYAKLVDFSVDSTKETY